ncbi:hypothetical protein AYI68_g569 [Smittium mucronatum]|uniref:GAT domain-containing protein n=1 Tax=Smittium mucronatum TaxID=133383 RepID=A0A1R0H840_9FUNG|nr:hypothetical protein AYI68_g569 [Smittium mucronatum]
MYATQMQKMPQISEFQNLNEAYKISPVSQSTRDIDPTLFAPNMPQDYFLNPSVSPMDISKCEHVANKAFSSCELLKDILDNTVNIFDTESTETMKDLANHLETYKAQISSYLPTLPDENEKTMDMLINANDQITESLLLYESFKQTRQSEKNRAEKYKENGGNLTIFSHEYNVQGSSKDNSSSESVNLITLNQGFDSTHPYLNEKNTFMEGNSTSRNISNTQDFNDKSAYSLFVFSPFTVWFFLLFSAKMDGPLPKNAIGSVEP